MFLGSSLVPSDRRSPTARTSTDGRSTNNAGGEGDQVTGRYCVDLASTTRMIAGPVGGAS